MRNILLTLCLLVLSVSSFAQKDWAGFERYAESNKTLAEAPSAVFIGNSITDYWATNSPAFFANNNYVDRGISGQVTSQMLARFRRDVIDLKPRCVVILAGCNDIAMNQGYISVENIAGNIFSMAELAVAHDIIPVICSVLPAYKFPWRPEVEPAELVLRLNRLLKEYAGSHDLPYVDYHSAMKDKRNGLPEEYAKDGIHPTSQGYAQMEKIVKPVLDKLLK